MQAIKIFNRITKERIDIETYLKNVRHIPQFTKSEELELIKQLPSKAVEKKLIEANLRFAISVAKQYNAAGTSLPDLIQEANFGLVEAAAKFDPKMGVRFCSYAVWHCQKNIMKYLHTLPLVSIPHDVNTMRHRLNKIMSSENPQFEDDMLKIIGFEGGNMQRVRMAQFSVVSTDAPIDEDMNRLEIAGDMSTDAGTEQSHTKTMIERAMKVLNEEERIVIRAYFGFDWVEQSLTSCGELIGCVAENARLIKNRALKKMARAVSI